MGERYAVPKLCTRFGSVFGLNWYFSRYEQVLAGIISVVLAGISRY